MKTLALFSKCLTAIAISHLFLFQVHAQPKISWDAQSLSVDGHRVCPVMGEIHYSRLPQDEWQREVRMMKDGGVTIIATYVFWNHIEEEKDIFRWDGQLHEICRAPL